MADTTRYHAPFERMSEYSYTFVPEDEADVRYQGRVFNLCLKGVGKLMGMAQIVKFRRVTRSPSGARNALRVLLGKTGVEPRVKWEVVWDISVHKSCSFIIYSHAPARGPGSVRENLAMEAVNEHDFALRVLLLDKVFDPIEQAAEKYVASLTTAIGETPERLRLAA